MKEVKGYCNFQKLDDYAMNCLQYSDLYNLNISFEGVVFVCKNCRDKAQKIIDTRNKVLEQMTPGQRINLFKTERDIESVIKIPPRNISDLDLEDPNHDPLEEHYYTPAMNKWLIDNSHKFTIREIKYKLKAKFGRDKTDEQLREKCRQMGLKYVYQVKRQYILKEKTSKKTVYYERNK